MSMSEAKSADLPDRAAACRRHERQHLVRQEACRRVGVPASAGCDSRKAALQPRGGSRWQHPKRCVERAARIRSLSLHGLSHDAWGRYTAKGAWDYRILVPGYKDNLTDVAAAIGLHQLARAESMREEREVIAERYLTAFADVAGLELPATDPDRVHAWHLFQVKLPPGADRDGFLAGLQARGIGFSVHWRPLHLHR